MLISMLPLETERLKMRRTELSDTELLVKMDHNENVQRFLGGIKNSAVCSRQKFIEKKITKFEQDLVGMLTVVLKSENKPIGFINFNIDEECNNSEISYIFDYDHWHKGYCTEAAKKLVQIGFENLKLHRIYADTISENIGSIKVLEKIGMINEGERRDQAFLKDIGEYRSFINYGILENEYFKI